MQTYKQKRPDRLFRVRVNPTYAVFSCPEKQAQEARGVFGCHLYRSCPNCRVEFTGWELWGENGHKQGGAADREHLVHLISRKAREQWRMRDGGIMGYRFALGEPLYYVG